MTKPLLIALFAMALIGCGTCQQNVKTARTVTVGTINALAPFAPSVFDDPVEASAWVKTTRALVDALMSTLGGTCKEEPQVSVSPKAPAPKRPIGFQPSTVEGPPAAPKNTHKPSPSASQIWPGF